jgi:hypothetical protein
LAIVPPYSLCRSGGEAIRKSPAAWPLLVPRFPRRRPYRDIDRPGETFATNETRRDPKDSGSAVDRRCSRDVAGPKPSAALRMIAKQEHASEMDSGPGNVKDPPVTVPSPAGWAGTPRQHACPTSALVAGIIADVGILWAKSVLQARTAPAS